MKMYRQGPEDELSRHYSTEAAHKVVKTARSG
jgi:hypothetical protein